VSADAADALMTVDEVAVRLRVTTTTVRRWIKGGKLRALRMTGGTLRITQEDLAAFERQHGTIPAQEGTHSAEPDPEEWGGYTDAAALGAAASESG